ncbi:hypothetical protein V6N12_041678 [Hibiscus sabdariffa]|uniref:Uncharacterized protein n=1 Tax=Hibiscus sabdariffa TaxID=183260 RepID=A0ABR2BIJ9_9ROSI
MYVESILTASVNQTGLGLSRALATTYVALWKASGPNCIKISVDRAMDEWRCSVVNVDLWAILNGLINQIVIPKINCMTSKPLKTPPKLVESLPIIVCFCKHEG